MDRLSITKKILLPFITAFCVFHQSNSLGANNTGLNKKYPLRNTLEGDINIYIDETSYDQQMERRIINQQVFNTILEQIHQAESFIILDFFLWNAWKGKMEADSIYRELSSELAKALIRKKREQPGIRIVCLTDPINRIYEQDDPKFYQDLVRAEIPVVFSDLSKLRDSNKIYSWPMKPIGLVFKLFKWADGRYIGNPFDEEPRKISITQSSRLLHFKANHRKVIISDTKGSCYATATSFNPANGSSAHSNIGLQLRGNVAWDALDSELRCIQWSAKKRSCRLDPNRENLDAAIAAIRNKLVSNNHKGHAENGAGPAAQWLTEGRIREKILAMFNGASKGDHARISMFYLSELKVIKAIEKAANRGVEINLILDPNRDAFGRKKTGVPNRPVAARLLKESQNKIKIRWADTHGEQFHLKAASITNPAKGKYEFICGSANWTRRNINNFNMEADVYLKNTRKTVSDYNDFFDRAWSNSDGFSHTLDYEKYGLEGMKLMRKKLRYYIQEATGLSTF